MKEAFGRVVGKALHNLEKQRDEARQERDSARKEIDELKAKLEAEQTWRIAACNAHATLSRGIKRALRLKNWPDFYKLYGDGLFATGVIRLLQEKMDAKTRQIKELKHESAAIRQPKRTTVVSRRKHARKGSRCA